MKKIKRNVVIRIIVALVAVAVLIVVGRKLVMNKRAALAAAPEFKLNAKPVETALAVKGSLEEEHEYLAEIEPFQTADISARVMATVVKVWRQEGDVVKAGEDLALLDDRLVRDGIAVVEAQIAQAQAEDAANTATLESLRKTSAYWLNEKTRDDKLADSGTITRAQAQASAEKYNEAMGKQRNADKRSLVIKQQIQMYERKIDELKTNLAYYTLLSPFDGIVSAKLVAEGDLAAPGKPLFMLEDRSTVKLAFDVPQGDLPVVKAGVEAVFEYGGKSFRTTISRIYPKLNRARMLRAEALLTKDAAAAVPLGAYVTLAVQFTLHKDAVLIPTSAIVEVRGQRLVYTISDGILRGCEIKLLGAACETAAVEGVEAGDEVVVSSFLGWARLADGMKVESK